MYLCGYIFILSFRGGCVIPDGDSMVLTGGFRRWKHVTRYPGNAELPQLNDERSNHGCSSFLLDDGNKVCKKCKYTIQVVSILSFQIYIVAGGSNPSKEFLETTEMFITIWILVGSLPFGVYGLAGATINNTVFMSGEYCDFSLILE